MTWRYTVGNTIFIVDDAEFMRVMLRDICQDMGLDVVGEAGDGAQAVAMYRDLSPDLVLLDITMPDMDGTVALQEILATDPDAQIVMITALGQKEQVLSAIKSGARDFIIKPFDQERVTETLSRILPSLPVG
jgi:two-component system chemotaxis response regulator CheY